MKDTSVLIYSCDKYADVWGPFFTLFFRYWDCPYPVYVTAETEQCMLPEVMTINTDAPTWTERIKDAVDQIDTKYVIGMCEDMFIRRKVDQTTINNCLITMNEDDNIASFNFEKEYDWVENNYIFDFGRKPKGSPYRKTCQPTLWRRSVLSELLDTKMDAWEWEMSPTPDQYDYYVWTGDERCLVFEYGYHNNQWFGIQKGKWVLHDVQPLFEKEGINIDLSIRGIV